MLRNLTNNPLLPRRCRLLLHPNRLCATATATSSAAAGEIAPAPAANETPLEDDLAEELRSRLVRDTCRLLELRDSWSAKLEAQLRHLLRAMTPPQVRAVLRAQAQRDAAPRSSSSDGLTASGSTATPRRCSTKCLRSSAAPGSTTQRAASCAS